MEVYINITQKTSLQSTFDLHPVNSNPAMMNPLAQFPEIPN